MLFIKGMHQQEKRVSEHNTYTGTLCIQEVYIYPVTVGFADYIDNADYVEGKVNNVLWLSRLLSQLDIPMPWVGLC